MAIRYNILRYVLLRASDAGEGASGKKQGENARSSGNVATERFRTPQGRGTTAALDASDQ
jgi:hypothetical protein